MLSDLLIEVAELGRGNEEGMPQDLEIHQAGSL